MVMSDMRQGQGKVIKGGESKENQGQVLKKNNLFSSRSMAETVRERYLKLKS